GIRDFHVTGVQTCALPICLLDEARTATGGVDDDIGMQLLHCLSILDLDADDAQRCNFAHDEQAGDAYAREHRDRWMFLHIAAHRSEERRVGEEDRTSGRLS